MQNCSEIPALTVIEKSGSSADPLKILIVGVFHGEEPQGEFILNKYMKTTPSFCPQNNLYFIPCLNKWGMQRGLRVNKNGVDLNRNYPTKNWIKTERNENFSGETVASEEETLFMIKLLEEIKPDIILTLHAPLKCVNYDGPAKKLAEKIADFFAYPVVADLGYPTPGSFGTYCGTERNIPTITLEYDDEENPEHLYLKTEQVLNWLGNLKVIPK